MEEKEKTKREMLIESILEKTNKYTKEQLEKILDEKEDKILQSVLRQTNLDIEVAKKMLEENHYDGIKVIKQHFGIRDKEQSDKVSVNQQVYREIRGFMDFAAKKYRYTKELEKRREEMLEYLKNKNSGLDAINETDENNTDENNTDENNTDINK